jgi:hypothetical protein
MAEAWTRAVCGDRFEPHSAGILAHGLDGDARQDARRRMVLIG